ELNGENGVLYTLEGISISASLSGATPPPAATTDYYWESGAGHWSDAKWSTTDGATSGQTTLPTSGTVNVVFNNAETASISIGTGVSVNDMSVNAGTYTFTGDEAATLDVAGTLTVGSGATANIKTAVEVGSIEVAGTLGISQSIKVAENGTVILDAAGTINLQDFEPTTSTTNFVDSMNAFGTTINTYKVFDGGSISGTIGTWQIDGTTTTDGTFHADTGEYTIAAEGEIYGVGTGTVNSSSVTGAEGFALNGGELVLDAAPTEAGFITATDKGGTLNLNGKTLKQSALGVLAGATVLESGDDASSASSIYDLGDDKALASNLSLSDTWKGTVKMGNIGTGATPPENLNISRLGLTGSSIEMGVVRVNKLISRSAAAVQADSLTLGDESVVNGALTLTSGTLTLGSAAASLTAASLETSSGDLTIAASSQDVLDALNTKASQRAIPILTLTADDFDGDLTQKEIVVPTRAAAPVEKYFTELQWNATKTQLSYAARVNPDYVGARVEATTQNGLAGVALLQQALQQVNPQVTAPDSALAAVLNAVDAGELSEEGAAAVAGAATAVLGMAAHGDLDRQLQAIRNRTTTMGVDQSVVHHDMPYFNAWINAEGDYSELSDDGTEGGYKLNSWGGTVGFDVDITPTFTAGMALTAMYGDLDVTGTDTASGELNTYYVSAFARYCASAWTHTFVATAGLSDITLDRTVMGEEINGETDGVSFGLMYEVGRVFALDEDGTACLQPIFNVTWRHTSVSGYTEDGSDLALKVDEQTLDTVTFGVGARLQAIVGESMYNRTSIFECRLLAKFDAGDRSSTNDVALAALDGDGMSASVESAERGPIGLEAGAGLTIPLGDEGGSLFMDAAIELRADYTNVNGTVGYRVNF
ncbi:MAG: autotransporter outer membrane beta-barrel domain-containing protein, partial [Akkermansia sp.]|nr:autotransporter outer membrane beta-barrel domain-containing protein [Akkermansia sp.]